MDTLTTITIIDSIIVLNNASVLDSLTIVSIGDTLKIKDTVNFLSHPSFYLSIATILIALIALILPSIRKKAEEQKKYRQLTKYIFFLLQSLVQTINIRIPQLEKLSEQIKNINSGNIVHESILLHSVKSLTNINRDNLFKIFIARGKQSKSEDNMHYKSIVDAIEYFLKQDDYNRINFEKFHTDLRKYRSDFKENLDAIIRLFDRFLSYNKRENIKSSEDIFFKGCDEIIHLWQQSENNNNYYITRDKFLIPLKEHTKIHISDDRAVQILEQIIKCNYSLDDMINICDVYSKSFNSVVDTMNKKRDDLEAALKHFKNIA